MGLMEKIKYNKINKKSFYTVEQAAELIGTASTKDTRKQMIWRMIRQGRIESIDRGHGQAPRYLIKGEELQNYPEKQVKQGTYER
jgi:hypothetical protein